jgi:hypothetical protein
VIFVPEWPNREFVSFVGFILLTKSLACNVAIVNKDAVYFRIFKVFRVYFSNTEKALL